ncbi:phosphatidylserine decarboxylase family protein [Blattabacterium cuenoti]|uniref:phosphatidylserine decarboxylase family protein n=1 Tax=Blattabacterium cuenoti TaxID=1653831 RepID=UPI00163C586F|nr:phosphatidylserine decarboxylase family protein [Blattabacterium cuenoti]
MTIHKEGYSFLIWTFLMLILLIIFSFFLFSKLLYSFIFMFLIIIFYSFLIFFFRNPKIDLQKINKEENVVISPADGKIIELKKVFEKEFLNKNCICVSIFMSLFDVHVNRYPVSGKVIYSKYHPGKYMVAWLSKSSLKNEHTTIVVNTKENKKILFRQIAGFLARRIVLYAKNNFFVKKGEEFGFIKFGSRIDIFIPENSIIKVKKGERVTGGITKISIIR